MRFPEPTPQLAPQTRVERALQWLSLLSVVSCGVYLLQAWEGVPERIPQHFGFDGTPDSWGDRGALWILPVLGLVLVTGLSLLERVPHLYNYPIKLTEGIRLAAYRRGRQFMCGVKTIVALVFSYATFVVIETARGATVGLGPLFAPALLALILGWLGVFWIQVRRLREAAPH